MDAEDAAREWADNARAAYVREHAIWAGGVMYLPEAFHSGQPIYEFSGPDR